eukprot:jgi/Ulvmu1/12308/UM088_0028.1
MLATAAGFGCVPVGHTEAWRTGYTVRMAPSAEERSGRGVAGDLTRLRHWLQGQPHKLAHWEVCMHPGGSAAADACSLVLEVEALAAVMLDHVSHLTMAAFAGQA